MKISGFAVLASLALASCATDAGQHARLTGAQAVAQSAPMAAKAEAEARTFMAGYAADLRARAVPAIVARYDRAGAWMVFEGERQFADTAALEKMYAEGWTGPDDFAWRDLRYDVLAPDLVLVVGGFDGTFQGKTRAMSYTGLLRRGAEGWRIRFENEGREPPVRR